MRAIAIADFDTVPTVTDVPAPTPEPSEILVQVHASSVNGFDVAVAAGQLNGIMEHRFPVVLGKDFAGTVSALGEGVTRFAVGDLVFGVVMRPYLGDGGLGEYVSVPEGFGVARIPTGLAVSDAGALGLAGTAAHDAVAALGSVDGDTVLIAGATGGVGSIAVQFAAAAGAEVIATARAGSEEDFVRDLGATHTVDYTAELNTQVRSIAPGGVSAIVHLAGQADTLPGLLAAGGQIASTLGFGPEQHPAATAVMANPAPDVLDRLAADAAAGRLRVPITDTFALEKVPDALAAFGQGAVGKLAITV